MMMMMMMMLLIDLVFAYLRFTYCRVAPGGSAPSKGAARRSDPFCVASEIASLSEQHRLYLQERRPLVVEKAVVVERRRMVVCLMVVVLVENKA
jgi:hypothetical protein